MARRGVATVGMLVVAGCGPGDLGDDDAGVSANDGSRASQGDAVVIEPGRLGPFVVGATAQDLAAKGLAKRVQSACGSRFEVVSDDAYGEFREGSTDDLDSVTLPRGAPGAAAYRTPAGVGIDATVAQLRAAYGEDLRLWWSQGEGGAYAAYVVLDRSGGAIVFTIDAELRKDGTSGQVLQFVEDSRIRAISVSRGTSPAAAIASLYYGC